jgi:hypothetical protein
MKRIILYGLLLLVATGFKCGESYPVSDIAREVANSSGGVPLSYAVQQEAPCSETDKALHIGKTPLSGEQLEAICKGLDLLKTSAIDDGFKPSAVKPYSFYQVFTPPFECVRSPEQQIMSFMVNGGGPHQGYDGSEYDQYNPKGKLKTPFVDARGLRQVFVQDGRSAVFAAELVLSIGTPGSTFPIGMMYVCPDMSVLRDGVRHGGDHIQLANAPYTEEFRDRGPYDVWAWFNASLVHGPPHPLLPRPEFAGMSLTCPDGEQVPFTCKLVVDKNAPKPSIITEVTLTDSQKEKLLDFGVTGDKVVTSSTMIIKAVK